MGRKCKAVVHSGAQVIKINMDCFKECMRGKQSRPSRLKCVAENNSLLSEVVDDVEIVAPNDTAYKRWSCHSGFKPLCKLCRTSPPPAMAARFTVFLGMPAMRTRWMAGAAAHKSG